MRKLRKKKGVHKEIRKSMEKIDEENIILRKYDKYEKMCESKSGENTKKL